MKTYYQVVIKDNGNNVVGKQLSVLQLQQVFLSYLSS